MLHICLSVLVLLPYKQPDGGRSSRMQCVSCWPQHPSWPAASQPPQSRRPQLREPQSEFISINMLVQRAYVNSVHVPYLHTKGRIDHWSAGRCWHALSGGGGRLPGVHALPPGNTQILPHESKSSRNPCNRGGIELLRDRWCVDERMLSAESQGNVFSFNN